MLYITCVPAYGRDYQSEEEVKAAWDAGKDFRCVSVNTNGGYVNKDDAPQDATMMIRYKKLTEQCAIETKGEPQP